MSRAQEGFTIVEVTISVGILAIVIASVLSVFLSSSALTELSRNATFAISAAEDKIEEIRNTPFNQIINTYDNTQFSVIEPQAARGFIYVDEIDPDDLLRVKVTVCWRNLNGRVIGEDSDLDGNVDAGEDPGADGFDSPVTIISLIAVRG